MVLATTRWEPKLDTQEAILADLTVAFDVGDPDLIAAAISDVARARGVAMPPTPSLREALEALRASGVELAARVA